MLGFIVAFAAGFATPHLEGPVVGPIVKMLDGRIAVESGEKRVIAFMIAMLGASIAAAVLNSGTTFWIIVGGILGYFALRIVAAVKRGLDARNTDQT